MVTIKTGAALVDFKGEEIQDPDGNKVLVGETIANIVASHDVNISRCWQLGKEFSTKDEVKLKAEDVVFLTTAIEKCGEGKGRIKMSALVTGQLIELLDPVEEDKTKK